MKTLSFRSLAVVLALGLLPGAGLANTLTVSPTSISVPASAQSTTITVRSGNQGMAHGQVRVYRSVKVGQAEQLSQRFRSAVRPVGGQRCDLPGLECQIDVFQGLRPGKQIFVIKAVVRIEQFPGMVKCAGQLGQRLDVCSAEACSQKGVS